MHQKNPFAGDYDFDSLVQHYASLKDFVFINEYGSKTIKFGDKKAVKALNSALLKAQYGIEWDIPDENLCPPIPGRLDYLLHIADLIPKKDIRLLDIGAGANLIYPILGCCHFSWKCTASEVDLNSLKNARGIIDKNPILSKIELRHQKFKDRIFEYIVQPDDVFDVVVCNPPFFKSFQDALRNNQRKVDKLQLKEKDKQNFGGISKELWYKGGEEAFVKRMARESIRFRNQIHWFTSLISRNENLRNIKRAINKTPATEVKVVEMGQGNKKSRFIAWTFR